jgi:hypothetical protein
MRTKWTWIKDSIVCSIAIFALMIAGSDGPYFPWVNFAGIAILAILAAAAAYIEQRQKSASWKRRHLNSPQRITERFARR